MRIFQNFTVFIITALMLVTGCTQTPREKMQGKWKIDVSQLPEGAQKKYDQAPPEKRKEYDKMKAEMTNMVYHLKEDGDYTVKLKGRKGAKEERGTWEVDKEGKVMILQEQGSETKKVYEIRQLTGSTAKLAERGDDDVYTLVKVE
jgi:Skp family chaperone for outer membrane proteins